MLEKILKKYWGYDSFRPLQKEIIESVLEGKDTLGILPTGGGKSITFQVPGMAREGVVLVVTPLISLMKDQVDNLRKRRIQAVYLHSGMTLREKNLAKERLFNNKAKFLYVSPERISSDFFITEIKNLKVNLIVVDEAHCISQWGYDFRPSYLKINKLRKVFPNTTVLALTASATEGVAIDICRKLQFGSDARILRSSVKRDNLSYVVRRSDSKLADIQKILSSIEGSGIVYVRSRKKTREISEYLNNFGIESTFYHAGLDNDIKEERQTKWQNGEIRVIVATNAFGMGIDKADVRIVLHYDMPPSLEEYYQEAGRAGRDGKQSYAVLLTAKSDKSTLRRRLTMEFPPKNEIKKIYTRLCIFSHLEIGEGYNKTVEFDLDKFCNTFKMDESVVRPSLRILSQAGYAEFIEEFENSSRLMVTMEHEELNKIRLSTPLHEKILTSILRLYPGLFTDYIFISEKKIAYHAQVDPNEVYEKLVELSKSKVISYIPRRKTPMLYFPTAMEEEKYVAIGKNVYEDRKEILRSRIESMIDYGFSEGECRITKLMTYFGEVAKSECGHCDTCREKKKKASAGVKDSDLRQRLKMLMSRNSGMASDSELKSVFGRNYERVVAHLRLLCHDEMAVYEQGLWKLKN